MDTPPSAWPVSWFPPAPPPRATNRLHRIFSVRRQPQIPQQDRVCTVHVILHETTFLHVWLQPQYKGIKKCCTDGNLKKKKKKLIYHLKKKFKEGFVFSIDSAHILTGRTFLPNTFKNKNTPNLKCRKSGWLFCLHQVLLLDRAGLRTFWVLVVALKTHNKR